MPKRSRTPKGADSEKDLTLAPLFTEIPPARVRIGLIALALVDWLDELATLSRAEQALVLAYLEKRLWKGGPDLNQWLDD